MVLSTPAGSQPGPFPTPGTPAWFGTQPYRQPAPPPGRLTLGQVLTAATPGLCIILLIGGLIVPLSPVLLGVALGLSGRVRSATKPIRGVFIAAVAVVAFVAFVGTTTIQTGFGDWWHFVGVWSLVMCWLTLAAVLGLVYRELKTNGPRPPTTWA
jgi:hypothetical protein